MTTLESKYHDELAVRLAGIEPLSDLWFQTVEAFAEEVDARLRFPRIRCRLGGAFLPRDDL